ncbi:vitamin K epoxide reductase family protein [Streptomyces sp. NRRL F-5065]|uniref:vitamin K epoxide reductase family protein n=1 Tax=Streptomyces sp. NRRL F-5065 TaxID=1463855 RepID=UPI0004BE4BFB|nr:vitamin K epoxide reductase family protein [Streptomyces sp. NRRL F-5065]
MAGPAAGPRGGAPVAADRRTGLVLLLAGIVGWYASFRLTVDDWRMLRDPAYRPSCDISPVVSCGGVMSSPQGSLFGFPNMVLGLSAFAVVAAVGVAVLAGTRLPPWTWRALAGGALAGVVFVHWLLWQSLYELNKLCPYCVVVWVVTIALFWFLALLCLEHGLLRAPPGVRVLLRDTHGLLLAGWYGVIALLVLTRFWPYWSGPW